MNIKLLDFGCVHVYMMRFMSDDCMICFVIWSRQVNGWTEK